MAALSAARNTKERIGAVAEHPVKGSTTCWQGGIAVLNAGYAAPGTAATGLIAIGRFEESVANTGADGAVKARVKAGVFQFGNSAAGDAIAQTDAGADCFIVDDQTVAKTNGSNTRSRAGKIMAVDSGGVWVLIGLGN